MSKDVASIRQSSKPHFQEIFWRAAAEVLNYFCGHQSRLGDAARLRREQVIGSGLVEGTIKQRVNLRMKRSGSRWLPEQVGPFVELLAMADGPEWSESWADMLLDCLLHEAHPMILVLLIFPFFLILSSLCFVGLSLLPFAIPPPNGGCCYNLDFPGGSPVSAWRLRHSPGKPRHFFSQPTDFSVRGGLCVKAGFGKDRRTVLWPRDRQFFALFDLPM